MTDFQIHQFVRTPRGTGIIQGFIETKGQPPTIIVLLAPAHARKASRYYNLRTLYWFRPEELMNEIPCVTMK